MRGNDFQRCLTCFLSLVCQYAFREALLGRDNDSEYVDHILEVPFRR